MVTVPGAAARLVLPLTPGIAMTPVFRLYGATLLCSFLLLAGCNSGPSETEIHAAIEQSLSSVNNAISGIAGLAGADSEALQARLADLKRISCKKVPNTASPTYECEVQVTMELPLLGKQSGTEIVTLSKTSNGWITR